MCWREGLVWKREADRVLQTPSCGCGERRHGTLHFRVIFCLKTAVIVEEGRRCERPCLIPMLIFFLENLCQRRVLGFFLILLSNSTCGLIWIPLQRSRTKKLPKRFHMDESTGYFLWLFGFSIAVSVLYKSKTFVLFSEKYFKAA